MVTVEIFLVPIPGYGSRDHRFNEFHCALLNRLKGHYSSKSSLRRALKKFAPQAIAVSHFYGCWGWKALPVHVPTPPPQERELDDAYRI